MQKYYNFLDNNDLDCNSESEIKCELEKLCKVFSQKGEQKNIILCDFEWQILCIQKSFEYIIDKDNGIINGLSWRFSGTQTLEDGSQIPFYFPDVVKLSKADFEYCENRYKACKNLYMKTEYGLMVYFGQQTNFSKHNNFKKQLCNELFCLAKKYLEKITKVEKKYDVAHFIHILKLSFEIAKRAKLSNDINNLTKYIFDIHQNWNTARDSTLRIILDLSSLVYDKFEFFQDEMLQKILSKNLKGAKEIERKNPFGAIYIIDIMLKIEQKLGISQENSLKYKASIYEKMMQVAIKSKKDCFLAAEHAKNALEIYKSLKDQPKVDELSKEYGELRGKIQLIEQFFEFPSEYIQQMAKQISAIIAETTEREIISYFISTPWYKKNADIQNIAEKANKEHPLVSAASNFILDKFGNIIKKFQIGAESSFWYEYDFNRQNGVEIMRHFFTEAYKAEKLNYKSVIEYLETTWLNESIVRNYHSKTVEIKPLDTLKPCLKRLFLELELSSKDSNYQYDYVTVMDSLTLKIEQLLRNICEKLKIPTFKLREKNNDKLMMEKLLDDILDDLKPEKATGFDEEDRIFIKYVLTEKAGLNLRNRVAHGLMDINEYSFDEILLLFCIIVKLSKYKFIFIAQ